MLNLRIFQHFSRRQTIAAAQNQHALVLRGGLHGGDDKGFVVTGFVARGELQIAVNIQARIVFPLRYHQPLVGRMAFKHHGVAKITLLGLEHPAVGKNKGNQQQQQHGVAAPFQAAIARQMQPENAGGEQGNGGVEQAEQQRGACHAELGRKEKRKQQRHGKRAHVVKSEHAGNGVFECEPLLVEHAHHQRDFHADHRADNGNQRIQQRAKRRGGDAERGKQKQRGDAANQPHQQFNFYKAVQHVFIGDVAR